MEKRIFQTWPKGSRLAKGFVVLLFSLFLVGCGKYGPPLPPEAYSPSAVSDVVVIPSVNGLSFTWTSPDEDRRGEDLKDLVHFDIRRAKTEDLVQFLKDPVAESELVGRTYDYSQSLLEKKRKEAREKKLPVRKVKVDGQLRSHTFQDESVKAGQTYIYSIVPVNSEGVNGEVLQYVKVKFSGLTSTIQVLDSSAFEKPYTLDF